LKDKKQALDFLLAKYKEGKVDAETTIFLIEKLYDPRLTYPETQRLFRKHLGEIMPP
jgi:hypothetical protein